MKKLIYIIFIIVVASCGGEKKNAETSEPKAEYFFKEVTAVTSGNTDMILPEGITYRVLFQGSTDSVERADGKFFRAKESHDMLAFVPIQNSDHSAYLYIGHETYTANADLGDGGGASIMGLSKVDDKWKPYGIHHVDFSNVGFTARNCGGTKSPHGTVLTCEEIEPMSNKDLSMDGRAFTDTSDIGDMKAWQNQGWVVEVDPYSGKVLHKLYAMGRFMHEDVHCMADDKTVYLSDDSDPAVFFKFVADKKGDYTEGQLYAYKQSEDGKGGSWLEMPRDREPLIYIRGHALQMGATMFMRHEWMEEIDGKIYIAETGKDQFEWTPASETDCKPAKHLPVNEKGIGHDPYGRILVFDPKDNSMKVFLEGGTANKDNAKNLSGPDCITKMEKNGVTYMVISEDITGLDKNRVSSEALAAGEVYNEMYMLDMRIEEPTVDNLFRFAVAPNGSETTGTVLSPDGKSMFINIQHPRENNPEPFNCSSTIIIEGF